MRIADDVAWVDAAGLADAPSRAVYATRVPDGAPLVFDGSAWAIWTALAEQATDIAGRAAELLGTSPTAGVRADVGAFLDRLKADGLTQN